MKGILILVRILLACAAFVERQAVVTRKTALFAEKGKIQVKNRNTLTPAQRAIQRAIQEEEELNEFDKFKQVVYSVGDGISKIRNPNKNSKVIDGYAVSSTKGTPTQRLLENIPKRRVEIESSPSRSVFDSVKGVVYGTVDAATTISKTVTEKPKTPLEKLGARGDFKPVTKTYSKQAIEAIPDLTSPNPIKRVAAEIKLRDIQFKENASAKKKALQDGITQFKEIAYSIGDGIQNVAVEAQKLPGRIQNFVEGTVAFVQGIPVFVEETIDTVTSIPEKVEQKAVQVKTSVETTVDKGKKVVEDVRSIPEKVQQTAENTKKSYQAAVETVENVSTNAKVLLGLEKPKPTPPTTPPPKPKTAADVAWGVVGTVASGAGKAVWWVGKGVAGLTWKAAATGAQKVMEEASAKFQEARQQKPPAAPKKPAFISKDKATPKSAGKTMLSNLETATTAKTKDELDLDREIAEALQMAEDAIKEFERPAPPPPPPKVEPIVKAEPPLKVEASTTTKEEGMEVKSVEKGETVAKTEKAATKVKAAEPAVKGESAPKATKEETAVKSAVKEDSAPKVVQGEKAVKPAVKEDSAPKVAKAEKSVKSAVMEDSAAKAAEKVNAVKSDVKEDSVPKAAKEENSVNSAAKKDSTPKSAEEKTLKSTSKKKPKKSNKGFGKETSEA